MPYRDFCLRASYSSNYDVITLTETWLNPTTDNNQEFMDSNYEVFRKDRMNASSIKEKSGGGVLIAVKRTLECELVNMPELSTIESICVKIKSSKSATFVYCTYIQPSADFSMYVRHMKAISAIRGNVNHNDNIVILGDFNLPIIKWMPNNDGFDMIPLVGESQSTRANIGRMVLQSASENELFQMSNFENHSHNVLDLIFVNSPESTLVEKAAIFLIPEDKLDKAHVPLVCFVETEQYMASPTQANSRIFCFRKANYDLINAKLNGIDWSSFIDTSDINKAASFLYDTIHKTIEEFVPKSTFRLSNKPAWFNKELCNLKNVRNREHRKLRLRRSKNAHADETPFVSAKDRFENAHKKAHDDFLREIAKAAKNDPKRFWKFINSKRKENSIPGKLLFDGKQAQNDIDKAKYFAEYFSSVFLNYDEDMGIVDFVNLRVEHGFQNIIIAPEAILQALNRVNINKGQGPDRISPIFLRKCTESLVEPLHIIFNASLKMGIYPNTYKTGKTVPIFKSGSKSDIRNYRGVTVMPNIAKIFERVIYEQLKLIIFPRLSASQHGFLNSRNIETNLMEFAVHAHKAFERGTQIDVFYADIQKAFDTVNPYKLIRKLAKFPISNSFLRWMLSYLDNRKLYASVGQEKSDYFNVSSGVGQGTILGPLLFLVFFNDSDLFDGSSNPLIFNFADDKKIALEIRTQADVIELQKYISEFNNWCELNELKLNTMKCKIMTFSMKRQPLYAQYYIGDLTIERVHQIKDLGIIMDPKLKFIPHMEYIKNKAASIFAFVRRQCKHHIDKTTAKMLYCALTRSNLEFGSVVWSPYHSCHKKNIESVQKQAVIFLHNSYAHRVDDFRLAPYSERCAELEMTSLIRRRINASILFIHNVIKGKLSSRVLRNEIKLNTGIRSIRNPEFIRFQICRNDHSLNSPFNSACRAFNHAAMILDPTETEYEFRKKLIKLPDSIFGGLVAL